MMSQKDYITFAKIMRQLRPKLTPLVQDLTFAYESGRQDGKIRQWVLTCEAIADHFASERPQFDRGKWEKAINKED